LENKLAMALHASIFKDVFPLPFASPLSFYFSVPSFFAQFDAFN
jgi:hypothetical protein